MFGWLQPQCPLASEDLKWIERRMTWLCDEFGIARLLGITVILPTSEYFPEPFESTAPGVRTLLDRTCRYMDVDPSRVQLDFFSQHKSVAFNTDLIDPRSGAAGLYDEQSGRITIWLETSTLSDPFNVVATLAHELGHVHLLGDGRLSGEEPDHEPLTDLLTVFFGLGILTANAVIQEANWTSGGWSGWQVSSRGYLTAPLYGYGLALLAWYRGEQSPHWARHLRLDVRSPFKTSLRYLEATAAPTSPQQRDGPEIPPGAFPSQNDSEPEDAIVPMSDDEEYGDLDPQSADACVVLGVVHANNGEFREAVREFTQALDLDHEDGEVYILRGQTYLRMERFAEALSDGQRAVQFDPEDLEGYRLCGVARYRCNDLDRAIGDFDYILSYEAKDAEAYFWRGLANIALRDCDRAIADFSRAIRYAPNLTEAYVARGRAYEQIGQLEKARADQAEAERRAARLV